MVDGKYSNYTSEQIINEDYQKLCEQLLTLSADEKNKEKMKRNII